MTSAGSGAGNCAPSAAGRFGFTSATTLVWPTNATSAPMHCCASAPSCSARCRSTVRIVNWWVDSLSTSERCTAAPRSNGGRGPNGERDVELRQLVIETERFDAVVLYGASDLELFSKYGARCRGVDGARMTSAWVTSSWGLSCCRLRNPLGHPSWDLRWQTPAPVPWPPRKAPTRRKLPVGPPETQRTSNRNPWGPHSNAFPHGIAFDNGSQ